jgi:uncharacterized RDD family membrane protein YckC
MDSNFTPAESQPDLFDSYVEYTRASTGSRLLNYVIDNLFMRFVLTYATGYAVGYLLAILSPAFSSRLVYEEESGFLYIFLGLIIVYFNYIVYYTFCEFAFKGRTLGKLISGTKAIKHDGKALTFNDAMFRSLSRLVPFEAFSALWGEPWHDSWTKTVVVKAR